MQLADTCIFKTTALVGVQGYGSGGSRMRPLQGVDVAEEMTLNKMEKTYFKTGEKLLKIKTKLFSTISVIKGVYEVRSNSVV